ncbi:MAG: hypothetical protein K0S74_1112 [Chlamydiales bacterium]|jgi:hypothetical protein|nr:hypothetical protein [Chlamydiales bacterium]
MDNRIQSNRNQVSGLLSLYDGKNVACDDRKMSFNSRRIGISKQKCVIILETFLKNIVINVATGCEINRSDLELLAWLRHSTIVDALKPTKTIEKILNAIHSVFTTNHLSNLQALSNDPMKFIEQEITIQISHLLPKKLIGYPTKNAMKAAQKLYHEIDSNLENLFEGLENASYSLNQLDLGNRKVYVTCCYDENSVRKVIIGKDKFTRKNRPDQLDQAVELRFRKSPEHLKRLGLASNKANYISISSGIEHKSTEPLNKRKFAVLAADTYYKRNLLKGISGIQKPSPLLVKEHFKNQIYHAISYEVQQGESLVGGDLLPKQILADNEARALLKSLVATLLEMRKTNDENEILILGNLNLSKIRAIRDSRGCIIKALITQVDKIQKGKMPRAFEAGYSSFEHIKGFNEYQRKGWANKCLPADVNQDIFALAVIMLELTHEKMAKQLSSYIQGLTFQPDSLANKKEALKIFLEEECLDSKYKQYFLRAIDLNPKDIIEGRKLLEDMQEGI